MNELNIHSIQSTVLWATFLVAIAFGYVSHRTQFCAMGAIADVFNFKDWGRMRMWFLAIAVSSLNLQLMSVMGYADLHDTIYLGNRWSWLSGLTGGVLFGVGMVLASGCGSKTLIRLGAGNLKSLMVFLVLGVTAYMTLYGVFGVIRTDYLDPVQLEFKTNPYVPELLANLIGQNSPKLIEVLAISIPLMLLFISLFSQSAWNKKTLLGGIGIGLAVSAAWWIIFQLAYIPEHPDTLEKAYLGTRANRAEGLNFVASTAYSLEYLMFFSDHSHTLTVGVVTCFGVIFGATGSSLWGKTFRWETFRNVEDTANHIVGAVFMGIGGPLALGCTIGQGLSGVSTLSLVSWIILGSIVLGATLALKYQIWRA